MTEKEMRTWEAMCLAVVAQRIMTKDMGTGPEVSIPLENFALWKALSKKEQKEISGRTSVQGGIEIRIDSKKGVVTGIDNAVARVSMERVVSFDFFDAEEIKMSLTTKYPVIVKGKGITGPQKYLFKNLWDYELFTHSLAFLLPTQGAANYSFLEVEMAPFEGKLNLGRFFVNEKGWDAHNIGGSVNLWSAPLQDLTIKQVVFANRGMWSSDIISNGSPTIDFSKEHYEMLKKSHGKEAPAFLKTIKSKCVQNAPQYKYMAENIRSAYGIPYDGGPGVNMMRNVVDVIQRIIDTYSGELIQSLMDIFQIDSVETALERFNTQGEGEEDYDLPRIWLSGEFEALAIAAAWEGVDAVRDDGSLNLRWPFKTGTTFIAEYSALWLTQKVCFSDTPILLRYVGADKIQKEGG